MVVFHHGVLCADYDLGTAGDADSLTVLYAVWGMSDYHNVGRR